VVLNEGCAGIFEVLMNGKLIYTNRGRCGPLSTDEEVFSRIRNEPLPKDLPGNEPNGGCNCGCNCY